MLTPEKLFGHIIKLIHAPIHVYDVQGQLTAIYVDNGEQQDVMDCDPQFRGKLLGLCGEADSILLHLEADRVIYAVCRDGESTYLMGPCSLDRNTEAASKYLMKKHGLDTRKPFRLSYVSLLDFSEIALMMYETVTDKTMSVSQLQLESFLDDRMERGVDERINKVFYTMQEDAAIHNPYSQEAREQEAIRTGDLQALEESFKETYVGRIGTLSLDSLRNIKNLAIVLVTLASRSAIAGGVLPEVAYSLSDAFIQKVDELKNEGEIMALARHAETRYCQLVRASADKGNVNPLVVRCKELVLQRLHSKISVSDLARELEVNPNYLSHLFARETGTGLSEYISQEKVRFAKKQLIYTDDSFETIAYSFGFVTQSHFGRVFKKYAGMTPGKFREVYGQGAK